MGADYILDVACEPKLGLGQGDPVAGTAAMVGMLKQRARADSLREMMGGAEDASVRVVVLGPNGPEERDVTMKEMRDESRALDAYAASCRSCRACVFNQSFGCVGYLNYPLAETLDVWIANRIQSADTLGGFLLLQALRDFGLDGRPMQAWRQRPEVMASPSPSERVVKKKFLSSIRVNSDQILQAIFHVGSALNPTHCMMVLMWLGGLRIDGRVPGPGSAGDAAILVQLKNAMDVDARRGLAQLDLGDIADDPSIRGFQRLLSGLYEAWVLDVELLVDA